MMDPEQNTMQFILDDQVISIDFIKQNLNNTTPKYQIFGHSAGGQFVHRYVMYKPNARYDKIIASASGWYTETDLNISFPYGFMESPL